MRRDIQKKLLSTLDRYTGNLIHLTHTDLDAVCSDAIFRRKYGNLLTIFSSVQEYSSYLDLFAQIQRKTRFTLCMSDLGGRYEAVKPLTTLKRNGWHVEWRDHHIWDTQTLEDVTNTIDYLCVNRDFCGCEIVYQDLLESDPIAREIAAIGRDRDFWINKDHRSEVLSTVVSDSAMRGRIASRLAQGIFVDSEIENLYAAQIALKNESIKKALKISMLFDRTAITVSDGYTSDVAAALRERYNSIAEFVLRTNGTFSVRTIAPTSNQIAGVFGGGGHPHAAGGNLHFTIAERLGFRLFPYRMRKVRALIEAASQFD